MFSGLVCVGMLTALGRSTFTVLLMTGIVMRKMISNTNMTSTSGVVLIFATTDCSSEEPPTFIDILRSSRVFRRHPSKSPPEHSQVACRRLLADRGCGSCGRTRTTGLAGSHAGAAHQIGMQVA